MERNFEILKHPEKGFLAIKRGFSWPGLYFNWLWAFAKRLWVVGITLLVVAAVITFSSYTQSPMIGWMLGVISSLIVGVKGNYWRSKTAEKNGYAFLATISASSPEAAISRYVKGEISSNQSRSSLSLVPSSVQRVAAIVWLTFKAAFRYRLFWILSALVIGSVIGLPLLIKDDGTARGLTQILLTYTLGTITTLLGFATLWISCGTLARDIEEAQIQMVVTKPIARWQIWLGKWLGLVLLNAMLLTVAGASVFFLLQWRAKNLPPKEQQVLQNEIFLARGSLREPVSDDTAIVDAEVKKRIEQNPMTKLDAQLLRNQIEQQVKASQQIVEPNYARRWIIDLGLKKDSLRDQPLFIRVKFHSPETSPIGEPPTYRGVWVIGPPESQQTRMLDLPSVAADTFHEIPIPSNLWDANGKLTIEFRNYNKVALLFSESEGLEVLYREGNFGLNFVRGLAIVLCWLALMAAVGLAAATFLSFPVAAFFSLALLFIALSSDTMSKVVEDKSLNGAYDPERTALMNGVDSVAVPIFRVALRLVNMVQQFSPIDALSSGRSITWGQLGMAVGEVVIVMGGIFAALGIFVFSRRELAKVQVNA